MKDFINYKEIVCNNDIINNAFARNEYVKSKCCGYDYITKEYPNSNYHILKNSTINTQSKEFLQKLFYDIFINNLHNCKFWSIEYNFNYLHNDFTTILQVVVFYNESIESSKLDFDGDLQTLKDIEFDRIQKNFVNFQNQCIFCLQPYLVDTFVNEKEIQNISNFKNEIKEYIDTKYQDKKENLEKIEIFQNHFVKESHNINGENFNIVQPFNGDNFDGFLITATDQ